MKKKPSSAPVSGAGTLPPYLREGLFAALVASIAVLPVGHRRTQYVDVSAGKTSSDPVVVEATTKPAPTVAHIAEYRPLVESHSTAFTFDQETVNNVYAEMYDKVAEHLSTARKEGKKAIILAGEFHGQRNSLLLQFMLQDICEQLGVTDRAVEVDAPTLKQHVVEQARTNTDALLSELPGIPYPPDRVQAGYLKNVFLSTIFWGQPHKDNATDFEIYDASMNNQHMLEYIAQTWGHTSHAVDPLYRKVIENGKLVRAGQADSSTMLNDERDTAIAGALQALVGKERSCYGVLGAHHLPFVAEKLKQDASLAVLPLNFIGTRRIDDDLDLQKERPVMTAEGPRTVSECIYSYYTPAALFADQHVSPGEAFYLAMNAGAQHRANYRELPQTFVDQYHLATSELRAKAQSRISAPETGPIR